MEDESKGWQIQEYSPLDDEDGDNKVMIRRVIRRGLRIGKTILITGVVISSAPFILPPLMVVSAVGLACSVPFGVFVTSYVCAEKLMSKLLPMPKPPPPLPLMLEYKGSEVSDDFDSITDADIYDNELVDDYEVADEDGLVIRETEADLDSNFPLQMSEYVDVKGGVNMEEEEERLLNDTKADIEMRISLPVGEEMETVSEEKYYEGMAHEEEQKVEEGYQEDEESSVQQDEQSTAMSETEITGSEIHPMVEILRQERPADNVNIDDSNLAQKTYEDIACRVVEVEGPYGLTLGAIEQVTHGKESGDAYQPEPSMIVNLEGSAKHRGSTSDGKEVDENQFTAKCRAIEIDEVHSTGVEDRSEMSGGIETTIYIPSEVSMLTSEQDLVAKNDNRSEHGISIDPLTMELVGETPYVQKENLDEQHVATDVTSTTKRKKKSKKKKSKSEGMTAEGTVLKMLSAEQEGEISSTAGARNITDEDLLNLAGDKEAGAETLPNKTAVDVVQPTESGTISGTPSGRSIKTSPKKTYFSEEKIWENIEALRTIVGYKVARHQSCVEELKALYIFTGVEPPMSFESSPGVTDTPDLAEVHHKLQFLMAIVGVK